MCRHAWKWQRPAIVGESTGKIGDGALALMRLLEQPGAQRVLRRNVAASAYCRIELFEQSDAQMRCARRIRRDFADGQAYRCHAVSC
ncbi:hypothetical protein KCP70_20565 [Salmonella enterica subsp. enterica]|nr:hypothetical protein KCP70_20565 [Salmonella enterica subsp. enterica]